ncbi:glycosyltransferase [Sinisalibacter aestuarii]|uniref:Glycosyl transferase n=1 Tax=Sinisalibacter aestuarii TaxID=2949426 RepID=A0ABQ5LNH0_9RHOB|nr:glycosyltransferase [Sinisalibacter aestuarii]GKY86555.1 glycosyl transferase [Sinisalibacter aestuarii]
MDQDLATLGAGRVAAIVVTFQRLPQLTATLERLFATAPEHLAHIVVVDNASADGTGEWLATQDDPRLSVVTLPQNMGGAGGFEAGMRFAVETLDPDWLLVMDDDARPSPGALERFHAVPRGGHEAWAAAVFYPSGNLCEMNRPTRNPFWSPRAFLGALLSGRQGFHVSDTDYASGSASQIDAASFVGLFVSRAAVAKVGYPDPSLFIYADDVLYTLGIRKAGGTIAFDPTMRFEHDCESSQPGRKIYDPVWRAYYHHRNIIFVYRQAAGVLFWPVMLLFLIRWTFLARDYGAKAPAFRTLLRRAIHDGLRGDTSASLGEVKALAQSPSA